jgi:hypothetical protein
MSCHGGGVEIGSSLKVCGVGIILGGRRRREGQAPATGGRRDATHFRVWPFFFHVTRMGGVGVLSFGSGESGDDGSDSSF